MYCYILAGQFSRHALFITYYTHFMFLYLLALKIESEMINLIASSVTVISSRLIHVYYRKIRTKEE
jgi:hypothetical protein